MKNLIVVIFIFVSGVNVLAEDKKCFYVSSYHQGYAWSDGVERGIRSTLSGHCQVRQFDMDTKRNTSEEFMKSAALKAKKIIEEWKPDIVIISDDNAAQYLIQPYYLNNMTFTNSF